MEDLQCWAVVRGELLTPNQLNRIFKGFFQANRCRHCIGPGHGIIILYDWI